MLDWIRQTFDGGSPLPPTEVFIGRIVVAMVMGFVVAAIYAVSLGRRRTDAGTLPTTLVLLSILVAMVTLVIGDNQARAFGLVGALSIVRFRTVVEDTRDTAFVIFAVVVGMTAGAGCAVLAVIGIPVVAFAVNVMRILDGPRADDGSKAVALSVRIGLGHDPDTLLGAVFDRYFSHRRLTASCTARQGAAMEVAYTAVLKDAKASYRFVTELNQIEGVQNVELRDKSAT